MGINYGGCCASSRRYSLDEKTKRHIDPNPRIERAEKRGLYDAGAEVAEHLGRDRFLGKLEVRYPSF